MRNLHGRIPKSHRCILTEILASNSKCDHIFIFSNIYDYFFFLPVLFHLKSDRSYRSWPCKRKSVHKIPMNNRVHVGVNCMCGLELNSNQMRRGGYGTVIAMSSEYNRKNSLVHNKRLLNSVSRNDLKQRLTGSSERPLFLKANVFFLQHFFCCFLMIRLNILIVSVVILIHIAMMSFYEITLNIQSHHSHTEIK